MIVAWHLLLYLGTAFAHHSICQNICCFDVLPCNTIVCKQQQNIDTHMNRNRCWMRLFWIGTNRGQSMQSPSKYSMIYIVNWWSSIVIIFQVFGVCCCCCVHFVVKFVCKFLCDFYIHCDVIVPIYTLIGYVYIAYCLYTSYIFVCCCCCFSLFSFRIQWIEYETEPTTTQKQKSTYNQNIYVFCVIARYFTT